MPSPLTATSSGDRQLWIPPSKQLSYLLHPLLLHGTCLARPDHPALFLECWSHQIIYLLKTAQQLLLLIVAFAKLYSHLHATFVVFTFDLHYYFIINNTLNLNALPSPCPLRNSVLKGTGFTC